jgi:hypothetical protein
MPFNIIFGAIAVLVGIVTLILRSDEEQEHQDGLINYARENDFTFRERDDMFALNWHGDPFKPAALSGSTSSQNILIGTLPSGLGFCNFEYHDGNGSKSTVYEVCVLRLPRMLPPLAVYPEGFSGPVGSLISRPDIDFESDQFNQEFRISSDDTRFAYGVMTPQLIAWHLGPGRMLVPWRIEGNSLIAFRPGLGDSMSYSYRLTLMVELMNLIPQQVWDSYGR